MNRKQIIIVLYFNFIALLIIFLSGIKLGSDIQAVLHNIARHGITSIASGRIRPFSYTIDVGGTCETIYNYLLITSVITVGINIVILIIFTLLNNKENKHFLRK